MGAVMPRSWRRGYAYCAATNRDGSACGNKVATLPSGATIHRYCATHRRMMERARREKERQVRTYISAVTINAADDEMATAARITVDSGGGAEVEMRFTPRRHTEWSLRHQQATAACVEAGLVRWATVGPQGGEDSVLVATAALMDQLEPLFAIEITAPGEEE
jgi:hypothetical protein